MDRHVAVAKTASVVWVKFNRDLPVSNNCDMQTSVVDASLKYTVWLEVADPFVQWGANRLQ